MISNGKLTSGVRQHAWRLVAFLLIARQRRKGKTKADRCWKPAPFIRTVFWSCSSSEEGKEQRILSKSNRGKNLLLYITCVFSNNLNINNPYIFSTLQHDQVYFVVNFELQPCKNKERFNTCTSDLEIRLTAATQVISTYIHNSLISNHVFKL